MNNEESPNPYDKLKELTDASLEVKTLSDLKALVENITDFASDWETDINYPEASLMSFSIGLDAVIAFSTSINPSRHEANLIGLEIQKKAFKCLPKDLNFLDGLTLLRLGRAAAEFTEKLSQVIRPLPSQVIPFYEIAVVSFLISDPTFYTGHDLIDFAKSLYGYNFAIESHFKNFLTAKWQNRLEEDKLMEMQKISTFYLDCIDKILLTFESGYILFDLADMDEVTSQNPDQYRNQQDLITITIKDLLSLSIEYLNQISLEGRDLFYFEQAYELKESLRNIFANLDDLDLDQNVADYYSYCLLTYQNLRFKNLTKADDFDAAKQAILESIESYQTDLGYEDYRLAILARDIKALK